MYTKELSPLIKDQRIIGTKIEYRIFGVLICKKTLWMPEAFGLSEYSRWDTMW